MFRYNDSGSDFPDLVHESKSTEHEMRFKSKTQEKNQNSVPVKNGAIARNNVKTRDLS